MPAEQSRLFSSALGKDLLPLADFWAMQQLSQFLLVHLLFGL